MYLFVHNAFFSSFAQLVIKFVDKLTIHPFTPSLLFRLY